MNNVTVYSTKSCPYCVMAKEYLKSKNIEFEDVDVGSNMERAMEMVQKSGQQGVPVLDVNGQVIIGFNKPAIDQALK
ncbi:NrdH-redoxin [archaeon]|jgi:glutaredoxin-like YruB-family protein|nr:NrdH-redoxin [archaeon]NCP79325.1 NrdH-redoxin [archaeon]NCP97268.1 NrdH-redoxin [archaeon]NCQ07092.1 NrdH-redoxin [archaeon]NCQ50888.1 NrdH-redoxin [archaeon]